MGLECFERVESLTGLFDMFEKHDVLIQSDCQEWEVSHLRKERGRGGRGNTRERHDPLIFAPQ